MAGQNSSREPLSANQADGAVGSVRKALLWASFGQGSFFVMQFGSSVLLARLLTPRETGVFALGAAAVALVSALQALGLNNYLIRAEVLDRAMLATVFTVNMVLSALVAGSILGVGVLSQHMFAESGTLRVMMWMASTPVIAAIGLLPSSLLQREGDFRALSVLRIVATLIGNALTIVLALMGCSYMSLAYGWVVTCAVNALGACIMAPRHIHWRLGISDWRRVASFGAGMLMVNGTTQAQRQFLNLCLGRYQGLEAVGLFSRANNLYSLLIENTQTVAMRVFLVDFAEAARKGQGLRDRYRRVADMMTALLWPLFAGLAVLSGPSILLLYGSAWESLAVPLSLLCIAGILWISIAMAWELFVVANETGRQARLEINRTVVGAIMFAIGCQFGLRIAVATRIAESAYSVILYFPHIKRITGATSADLLPIYGRNALLTLVAIFPALILMQIFAWAPTTPLYLVFGSVFLGMFFWGSALVAARHPIAGEFIRLVSKQRKTAVGY